MRDSKRLFEIYDIIYQYHMNNPDLRMMQLIVIFFHWHYSTYGNDGFYIEDDKFIERFNEFIAEMENY